MATLLELPTQAGFLRENTSTFSVFDKKASAHRSHLQRALAITLRPLMKFVAEGKSSHWFDYVPLPEPEKYEGLEVVRDEYAFDVYHPNSIIYNIRKIRMSLGGWKSTALIGPNPDRNDLDKVKETGWLYAYRVYGEENKIKDAEYSKLVNPGYQSIVILRGPRRFDAIGLDPQTLEEIPLTGILSHIRGARIQ